MKIFSVKKRAIVLFSIGSLFYVSMVPTADLSQASIGGKQYNTLLKGKIHRIFPGFGLMREITDQELPSNVSRPIEERMKQPPDLGRDLSEKLKDRNMEISMQNVRLFELIPTADTLEEVRGILEEFPLSAYFIVHTIVDGGDGHKTGVLISKANGSLSLPLIDFVNQHGGKGFRAMSSHLGGGN